MGGWRGVIVGVTWVLVVVESVWRSSAQHQFDLVHRYAHMEGSSARAGKDGGMSLDHYHTLRKHDQRRLRRMLPEVVSFPISGDNDIFAMGLYYTRISLGTPPQQFYVDVDTGSNVAWVKCAPCTGCEHSGDVPVPMSTFDPRKSTTKISISCTDAECGVLNKKLQCSPERLSCPYSLLYGDGSSTAGYYLNDVFTFNQVPSDNSTAKSGTARLVFGCGGTQTGSWSVDGLLGFGPTTVSLPNQLAQQNISVNIFAHCLQGDVSGRGSLVIGTIREPDLVYTPMVFGEDHYNVQLLNIGISGRNVTTPASFDLEYTGGVIIDSGTTLTYLVQPAYDEFRRGVIDAAPTAISQIGDNENNTRSCFIYADSIEGSFPNVTLYFAEGAIMTLSPKNYLYKQMLTSGLTAYCFSWLVSTSPPGYKTYTIFGDNVLKDKLIVYDNAVQPKRIGWKDFDCAQGISVSSTATSMPVTVMPSEAGPPGASNSGIKDHSNGALSPCWLFTVGITSLLFHRFL